MRIATIGHSHIALRQQLFFKEVAERGNQVLMVSPGEWGALRAKNYSEVYSSPSGSFSFTTCQHMMGENIYQYHLLGAKDIVEQFKPDVLYIQAEPSSSLAQEAVMWNVDKRALFTWENIGFNDPALLALGKYDLVICGNPEAEALVRPWNPHTALILQVGVDTDHFQARPNVDRSIEVAYIGRVTPEKGLPYLKEAWPAVRVLEWKDFLELPWWYSQVQVVVAYSQDVPWWKEQAPNYVVLEALSCGCKAVVSDTSAMKYWVEGYPGVVMVKGHEQHDKSLHLERVGWLKEGIEMALNMHLAGEGRQWVVDRFSNPVVAKKLLEVLGGY